MAIATQTYKSILKAGAAVVVGLGLTLHMAATPAHALSKKDAVLIGIGVVGTAIILNEAAKNQHQGPHGPPQARPGPRNPKPRRTRTTVNRSQYSHAEAMRIQTALNMLGYEAGTVDGVVGPSTRRAISTFQIEIDETPTGVLTSKQKIILYDRAEVAKAGNQKTADNSVGPQDEVDEPVDIAEIQDALNILGYPAGDPDGVMGEQTRQAIIAFQIDIDHEPTGNLTDEELDILFEDAEEIADADDLADFDEDDEDDDV